MYFNVIFITSSRQHQLNLENRALGSDSISSICLSFLH